MVVCLFWKTCRKNHGEKLSSLIYFSIYLQYPNAEKIY